MFVRAYFSLFSSLLWRNERLGFPRISSHKQSFIRLLKIQQFEVEDGANKNWLIFFGNFRLTRHENTSQEVHNCHGPVF